MFSTSSAISFWSRNVIAYECSFGLVMVFQGHRVIPFDADDIYTATEVLPLVGTRRGAKRQLSNQK